MHLIKKPFLVGFREKIKVLREHARDFAHESVLWSLWQLSLKDSIEGCQPSNKIGTSHIHQLKSAYERWLAALSRERGGIMPVVYKR